MNTIDLEETKRLTAAAENTHGIRKGALYKMVGIEFAFKGNAVSLNGARGFFQIGEPTAKTYKVSVGDFASEADGAALHIKDNLAKY